MTFFDSGAWGHQPPMFVILSKHALLTKTRKNFSKYLVSNSIRHYFVSSPNPYASFGTLISNRAPVPGSPVSHMESPVMLRISAAK